VIYFILQPRKEGSLNGQQSLGLSRDLFQDLVWRISPAVTLPDGFQIIMLNIFIPCHKWYGFHLALGNQHTVK
jgi:hypothetical protein